MRIWLNSANGAIEGAKETAAELVSSAGTRRNPVFEFRTLFFAHM